MPPVVALRAGGGGGIDQSISWLAKVQNGDGGWGDIPGSPSTADGTGAAMQAMPGTSAAEHGLGYLRNTQRPSGGFPLGGSGSVNSQSTAWAVQGMLAVGTDPASVHEGGKSALEYLAARQDADGHYRFNPAGAATPPNEIWPGPFTTNDAGIGNGNTIADGTAGPTAVSVVVHAPGGAKIACADLG